MARPHGIRRARGLKRSSPFKRNVNTIMKLLGGIDKTYRATPRLAQQREATQYVGSQIAPRVREVEKSIGRRSAAGQGSITGYTKELAGIYDKGIADVNAAYDKQRSEEQAANDSLSQFLRGRGADASAELASKFQQAGLEAPPPSPEAGTPGPPTDAGRGPLPPTALPPEDTRLSQMPAGLGQGVGGESAARGFSALSRIGSEGAAARSLAAEMPGIAALGGQKASKDLQLQLNREQSDRVGELESQAPGLIQNILQTQQDRELQKAGARTALRGSRAEMYQNLLNSTEDRDLQRAIANQGLNTDMANLGEQQYQFDQQLGLDQDKLALENLDSIRKANGQARARRTAAYNKLVPFIDGLFKQDTNALGIPVAGQEQTTPQDAWERGRVFLQQQLPQAPKKVIDELLLSAMAANGIEEGFGGIAVTNPRKAKGKKVTRAHRGPRRPRKHRGGD